MPRGSRYHRAACTLSLGRSPRSEDRLRAWFSARESMGPQARARGLVATLVPLMGTGDKC
jgi:hypothetical protein